MSRQNDRAVVGYSASGTSAPQPGESAPSTGPEFRTYLETRFRLVAQEYVELRRLLGKEEEVDQLRRENAELKRRLRASPGSKADAP